MGWRAHMRGIYRLKMPACAKENARGAQQVKNSRALYRKRSAIVAPADGVRAGRAG